MIRVVADVGSSHSTCILTHIDSWIDQSCSMNQLCACTWIVQSQSFGMDQWSSLRLELVGVRYMLLRVGFCCTCTHACNVVAEYVKFDLFEEIICAHTHVHVHAKNVLLFFLSLFVLLFIPLLLSFFLLIFLPVWGWECCPFFNEWLHTAGLPEIQTVLFGGLYGWAS